MMVNKKKELLENEVVEKVEVKLPDIEFQDEDIEFENPRVVASRARNTITIYGNDKNYISAKLMLSRAEMKEYNQLGLDNFAFNSATKEVQMKEDIAISDLVGVDKDLKLEQMMYTKFVLDDLDVFSGKDKALFLETSGELVPLRKILINIIKKYNELGL